MKVEIDQSGKVGSKTHTVLAFSNSSDYAVILPAKVKRQFIQRARLLGKTGKHFYFQLFSLALFFLLKNFLKEITEMTIDIEYPRKDGIIKAAFLNLLSQDGKEIKPQNINFKRIGKHSQAHKKALKVFRKPKEADFVITLEELLKYSKP